MSRLTSLLPILILAMACGPQLKEPKAKNQKAVSSDQRGGSHAEIGRPPLAAKQFEDGPIDRESLDGTWRFETSLDSRANSRSVSAQGQLKIEGDAYLWEIEFVDAQGGRSRVHSESGRFHFEAFGDFITFEAQDGSIVLHDPEMVKNFNRDRVCGHSRWKIGVSVSLAQLNQCGVVIPKPSVIHVKSADGDRLNLEFCSWSGSEADRRLDCTEQVFVRSR